MKNICIITSLKKLPPTLVDMVGYHFEIPGNYEIIGDYSGYIIDTSDKFEGVVDIPYNKKSFYFPVQKISSVNRDKFLLELMGDQTVFTRYYDFVNETYLPTKFGEFYLFGFVNRITGKRILGLRTINIPEIPTVRTHSMCYTGDIFGSLKCDCREALENALQRIQLAGGMLIYPEEEGRGIGILNKIAVYNSQHKGYDTVDAQYINHFPNDLRNYRYLRDVFKYYNITSIKLITNNPEKVLAAEMSGVYLEEVIKINSTVTAHNEDYLLTKMNKSGHNFNNEFHR